MARRAAPGTGTIRKKTVTRAGRTYTYWEARYTVGRDPGTGRQIQRSISGKSQKEVAEKLKAATAALDAGTYIAPSKQTVAQWLDTWADTYLGGVKPSTAELYKCQANTCIKPALGAVRLEALTPPIIQRFYNGLTEPRGDKPGLAPKTVKNVHGVLHRALQQAVTVGILRYNPADACTLPRIERREIHPLDEVESKAFLAAIEGHPLQGLFTVALFTGMREGELLGLQWTSVDFKAGTITVKRQLQHMKSGAYAYTSPKNGKARTLKPAPAIMGLLKKHRIRQAEQRLRAGGLWVETGLVFTNDTGDHLSPHVVYNRFKAVAASIGRPGARFHDLRHSYAVAAIRAGDDIKTVQGNLGHATAAFTLDIYGHVTEQMKSDSSARMENYIQKISG